MHVLPDFRFSLCHTYASFLSAASEPTALEKQRDAFRSAPPALDHAAHPAAVLARSDEAARHFRLLKQRYIDLEAKRQFLFTITGDAPALAPGEAERLASENAEKKARLKVAKGEVARLRDETLRMAKDNADSKCPGAGGGGKGEGRSR